MKTLHAAVLILLLCLQPRISAGDGPPADTGPRMLVRCDDIGMCQSVNAAFRRVAETGIPVSASVMFACPWYRDAAEILRAHPHVSVGVHLVLNAEWRNYRWGPVAGHWGPICLNRICASCRSCSAGAAVLRIPSLTAALVSDCRLRGKIADVGNWTCV